MIFVILRDIGNFARFKLRHKAIDADRIKKDFLCYFENIDEIDKYKMRIENSLMIQNAIWSNKIVPYYQPIFDKNKKIVKYEALIRIIDKTENIILPGIFLKDSKHIKRYSEIEKIIIDKSLELLKDNAEATICVNLSVGDMADEDLSVYILDKISSLGIGERIVFEILEDENMLDNAKVDAFIKKARVLGVKISIDDFGSGYSNFSRILKIKPDYIKIDGSIIKNIDTDKASYIVADAIVAFAKKLGIKTIAEFVHSKDVFQTCVALEIDEFQGFYLGESKENL